MRLSEITNIVISIPIVIKFGHFKGGGHIKNCNDDDTDKERQRSLRGFIHLHE